jgi:tetratricopeptide (TPR) repeat protein
VNAALWLLWVAPFALAAHAAEGDGATWARSALDQALAASTDIHDPFHRAQSLAEIAETRAALGEHAVAMSLLQLAAESADQIDNPALSSWARHDIAVGYLRAGDAGHAEVVAETISDLQLRDAVLVAAADARRTRQDLSGALFTAWRIRDEGRQGEALRRIVIVQTSARQMQDALATTRSITHPVLAAVALGDVATAFARQGRMGEARKHALRIRDARVRSEIQAELASLQAEMGDAIDAARATKSIEDRLSRAQALARVAAATIREGKTAAGKELFASSLSLATGVRGMPERKTFTLLEIARAQISAGQSLEARETLRRAFAVVAPAKKSPGRLSLLQQIASLQARNGDHVSAIETAWQVDDASLRPQLMRDVVASQAESGDVAGAVRIALALDDEPAGAAALLGVLRVQSRSQDASGVSETITAALRAARTMKGSDLKAGALASLAAAQMSTGDAEAARQTYEEAMSVASRAEPGPARVAAFARIADALGVPGR